jgi:hypothetical protein
MVGVGCEVGVVPQETEIAVMEADLVNESLAEEIRFVFGQMHVVVVAKCAIHNR